MNVQKWVLDKRYHHIAAMSDNIGIKFSEAFSFSLKELAINEFPCGNGKWRNGNRWHCDASEFLNPPEEQNANLESIQSLLELMENEPFKTSSDWSEDCDRLRKIAIKNPEKITNDNIFQYFKKLRLVGRNITEVDDVLLKFKNLTDLTLTANLIQNIDLRIIPKTIEVLELYGNRIPSMAHFCCSLPTLIHFGIGNNSLTTINGMIHQTCWSNILSLDLSFNGLTALNDTLRTLKNLPKLNSLLLIGNPLFLASSYRGVVVDTLGLLTILDDVRITADEKHRYKGISRLKGLSVTEAVVEIGFDTLKGIKTPSDLENENGCDDTPKTEYRYQVSYSFLSNCIVIKSEMPVCEVTGSEGGPELNPDAEESSETDDENTYMDIGIEDEGSFLVKRKAKEGNWCEDEIKVGYERKLITSDLDNFKKFLLEGLCLEVIEHKVVVSLDSPEDCQSLMGDGEIDRGAKGSKPKVAQKDKTKQPAAPKSHPGKNKRKTKEAMPLYELSRESKTIGMVKLPLDAFMQGTKFFEKQCVIEKTKDTESEMQQEELKESKVSSVKKPPSLDGRKKGKELRKPSPAPSGQRSKSALSNKPSKSDRLEKAAKNKDNKTLGEIVEISTDHPSEITLDVAISLHSWKSTKEAQNWIYGIMN